LGLLRELFSCPSDSAVPSFAFLFFIGFSQFAQGLGA
jgi:hypothetical protein